MQSKFCAAILLKSGKAFFYKHVVRTKPKNEKNYSEIRKYVYSSSRNKHPPPLARIVSSPLCWCVGNYGFYYKYPCLIFLLTRLHINAKIGFREMRIRANSA